MSKPNSTLNCPKPAYLAPKTSWFSVYCPSVLCLSGVNSTEGLNDLDDLFGPEE